MSQLSTFLWFDSQAEEAVDFYLSIFPNAQRAGQMIAPDLGPAGPPHWKPGSVVTQAFSLDGHQLVAFNGGPGHPFSESISISVACADQAEIDRYWDAFLANGGEVIACGWLKDKWGLRWQIVPHNIAQLLSHPAAMQAMLPMTKMIIADLEAAGKS